MFNLGGEALKARRFTRRRVDETKVVDNTVSPNLETVEDVLINQFGVVPSDISKDPNTRFIELGLSDTEVIELAMMAEDMFGTPINYVRFNELGSENNMGHSENFTLGSFLGFFLESPER